MVRVGLQRHTEKKKCYREFSGRNHYKEQYVDDDGISGLQPAYRSKCQRTVIKREYVAFIARRWLSLPDTISSQTMLTVID
jgi:hypothetical protein